jgi:hypothetical protein
VGKGIFAWLTPVWKTKESDLVDRIGLDATVFLRFTRMCRNIFLVLSVFGCSIMIPVNIVEGEVSLSKGVSAFATMTPLFLFNKALWSHVACAWAFDVIVAYFLWRNYAAVRALRRQFFQSPEYQMSLHARTIMVGLTTIAGMVFMEHWLMGY